MRFVLEMKFASIEQIHRKFFSLTYDGVGSVSSQWCEKRVSQLEQAGYLKAERTATETKLQYLATAKAYRHLGILDPFGFLPKPLEGIEHRTFDHDREVLEFRLRLEETGRVKRWISERELVCEKITQFHLPRTLAPDGMYELYPRIMVKRLSKERENQRLVNNLVEEQLELENFAAACDLAGDQPLAGRTKIPKICEDVEVADLGLTAFELEIQDKNKARYQKKILSFVEAMRAEDEGQLRFKRVHILALKNYSYNSLKAETEIFGELFKVERGQPTLSSLAKLLARRAAAAAARASGEDIAAAAARSPRASAPEAPAEAVPAKPAPVETAPAPVSAEVLVATDSSSRSTGGSHDPL